MDDRALNTEELLKQLLREFKNWYDSGSERPPDSLINHRNEFMRKVSQMERDHLAMERLREDNPEVTWSYARGTLFKGYTPPQVMADVSKFHVSRDPAKAILGEHEAAPQQ